MTPQPQSLWLLVEQAGDVSIVRFRLRTLVKQGTIETIGDKLHELIDEQGRRRILLDFANVDGVASMLMGKLIGVARKLDETGGRTALCNLRQELADVFASLRLGQLIAIYPDEAMALQGLARA